MRLAETAMVHRPRASTSGQAGAVLSAISSATVIAQTLTRLPLEDALRECTELLATFDRMTPAERSTHVAEIAIVRRHCQILAALWRCACALEGIR